MPARCSLPRLRDIASWEGYLVAKTLLDLDDDLLAEATTALGTSSTRETVTEALRQAVESSRERRQRALTDLQEITDAGGFHFDQLDAIDRCST
ncbi:type II toxin-antitoxin system VapB family antitoxin [Solwaraspora sp. WMMA2101]|uniref:type II toxin-antitoxin system VapB family antitoxin n=1 Tax=Solwaraspora sp. WMMA2101 TaxID=3404124 RepID=UPI003B96427F